MPCACRAPAETYPENAEWGPLFWKLLHGMAEYVGKQVDPNYQVEEVRLWAQMLTTLQQTIPCDVCRAHYGEWLTENPPAAVQSLPYAEVSLWAQRWLWLLHNRINEGNDKPVFLFDQLQAVYKGTQITQSWKALTPVLQKAISLNGVTLLSWRNWLMIVRKLQGFWY